jgi:hypothetical protein
MFGSIEAHDHSKRAQLGLDSEGIENSVYRHLPVVDHAILANRVRARLKSVVRLSKRPDLRLKHCATSSYNPRSRPALGQGKY